MDKQALGWVVGERRHELGKSQAELAKEAGYSDNGGAISISRIENGKAAVPERRLAKLAEALDLTLDELRLRVAERTDRTGRAAHGIGGGARRVAFGEQSERNRRDRGLIEEIVASRTRVAQDVLEDATEKLTLATEKVLRPFALIMEDFPDAPRPPQARLASDEDVDLMPANDFAAYTLDQAGASLTALAGKGLAGGVAGGALGAGAAYGTFAAVAAWGTASTGTAIASLSGAAASSATLAAIGGGALSAGGLGVAGGAAVLGGIVAAPVLILGGVTLAVVGRKARREATTEVDRIALAWEEVSDAKPGFDAFVDAANRIGTAANSMTDHGTKLLYVWQRTVPPDQAWTHITDAAQSAYTDLMTIAVHVVSIAQVPVVRLLDLRGEEYELIAERVDAVLRSAEEALLALDQPQTSSTRRRHTRALEPSQNDHASRGLAPLETVRPKSED